MDCIVLKSNKCSITQNYSDNHPALDITGNNNQLDYIIAHSAGKVVYVQDGIGNIKGSVGNISYGNYIKVQHQDGYYTLYAHMRNGLDIKNNQSIEKGQVIGYMGDSGNAYGAHLHFEIWKDDKRINPIDFLNKELPNNSETSKLQYNVGDIVEINGLYISSTSNEKLRPLITKGKITRIVENANNPYLLEDGKIGWVNDNTIISKSTNNANKYLSNKHYKGNSLVDALREIDVNSSYQYRFELAQINNINNYKGTASQNTKMLNLLKQGLLKY